MDLKSEIVRIAEELGFQRAVIGGVEPMEDERRQFEFWLSKGYAAGMEYLKRNSHSRTSPALLHPGIRSAVVVSANYFTPPPPDPGPCFGRVARYAVGQDYHSVLRERLRRLQSELESMLGRPLLGKAFSDDVPLFEQAYAKKSGLGFAGKNSLIIGPRLSGSYQFVAELFTDLELEPDQPVAGTCGKCFRCGDVCPTGAIKPDAMLDAGLCLSYLTIENKGEIPLALRPKVGEWVFGCDLCQEVCPYNQKPPETTWPEFRPDSGVGHWLKLIELLQIQSDEEFRAWFKGTALLRPKRRGLLRNALVALGNRRPAEGVPALAQFASADPDAMLREHAAWALSCYDGSEARQALVRLHASEQDDATKALIREHLEQATCRR